MSRTPTGVGFYPDPNKWIKTTAKPKGPVQRPLAALKNGFPTPTPSRLADTSSGRSSTPSARGKGKEKQVEPEQSTLDRFRTPPATAKPRKAAIERIRKEVEALTGPISRPNSAEKIKTKEKEDTEEWGSDDIPQPDERRDIAGPSRASRTPDIVDLTTHSSPASSHHPSPSKHLVAEVASQAPIPIPSSNLQSLAPRRRTRSPAGYPERHLGTPAVAGLMSSSHRSRSPPSELSEGIPITPVPPSILAMHEHLCGRDFVKRPKDPALPKSQTKKRDIDHRAQEFKARRGEEKQLVQLSSDQPEHEEDDIQGKVLSPLRTNTMRSRHRRGTSVVETSKRSKGKALGRYHTTKIARDEEALPFRLDPPARPGEFDIPEQFAQRPSSPTLLGSSTPNPPTPTRTTVTPHKSPHHQITPPKSRSSHRHLEQAETLFAIPAPPPRPNFAISPAKSKRKPETWDAVEMNPETLLTWSLGGSEKQIDGDITAEVEHAGRTPVQSGKNVHGQRDGPHGPQRTAPKRPRLSSQSPAQSIGPSEQSQSFPILVHSSQPIPERQTEPRHAANVSSAKPDDTSRSAQTPGDRWSHLDRGILSVPVDEHVTPTAKPRSKKPRKSGTSTGTPKDGSQAKLAAFGFFTDHTPKAKAEDKVFETAWEDEEDIDLDIAEENDDVANLRKASMGKGKEKLGPVPEAPHHPGLRAAGVRELERRANPTVSLDRGLENNIDDEDPDRATSPPLFGEMTPRPSSSGPSTTTTPTTSSSVLDDLPGSVGNWWAGLSEREV